MRFVKIFADGSLRTLGPKANVNGVWVDSTAEIAASLGYKPLVEGVCGCGDCTQCETHPQNVCPLGRIPVSGSPEYTETQTSVVHNRVFAPLDSADPVSVAKSLAGTDVSQMTDRQKTSVIQKLVDFVAKTVALAAVAALPCLADTVTSNGVTFVKKGDLRDDDEVVIRAGGWQLLDATLADTRGLDETNDCLKAMSTDLTRIIRRDIKPVNVVSEFWDAQLEANWRFEIHDGDMRYYVSTNVDETAMLEANPVLTDEQTGERNRIVVENGEMKFFTKEEN